MNTTLLLASIIGPVLMVLSLSEFLNYKIWTETAPAPSLVYLNGLFLFVCGLIIVRIHNIWVTAWPVIVTLTGWLCMMAGAGRMFFPTQKQLPPNNITYLVIASLFLVGTVLTLKAYVLQ